MGKSKDLEKDLRKDLEKSPDKNERIILLEMYKIPTITNRELSVIVGIDERNLRKRILLNGETLTKVESGSLQKSSRNNNLQSVKLVAGEMSVV